MYVGVSESGANCVSINPSLRVPVYIGGDHKSTPHESLVKTLAQMTDKQELASAAPRPLQDETRPCTSDKGNAMNASNDRQTTQSLIVCVYIYIYINTHTCICHIHSFFLEGRMPTLHSTSSHIVTGSWGRYRLSELPQQRAPIQCCWKLHKE